MRYFWIGLIVLAIGVSACQTGSVDAPAIEVRDAWVRPTGSMGGMNGDQSMHDNQSGMGGSGINSAAYMVIENKGRVSENLLRVEGDIAHAIELHRSEIVDGVMRMSPVANIEIPAGNQVELKPGGLHIMLINLKGEIKPGDQVSLNLIFELSGKMTVFVEARQP